MPRAKPGARARFWSPGQPGKARNRGSAGGLKAAIRNLQCPNILSLRDHLPPLRAVVATAGQDVFILIDRQRCPSHHRSIAPFTMSPPITAARPLRSTCSRLHSTISSGSTHGPRHVPIIRSVPQLRRWRKEARSRGLEVGLVPTVSITQRIILSNDDDDDGDDYSGGFENLYRRASAERTELSPPYRLIALLRRKQTSRRRSDGPPSPALLVIAKQGGLGDSVDATVQVAGFGACVLELYAELCSSKALS